MKTFLGIVMSLFIGQSLLAQAPKSPKLVVGIVVDQMRYDYIYRYWDNYSENGFKRLVNKGYFCRNVQYHYVPTYTGPGHSSIYTGSSPHITGIVSNDWFDRIEGKMVYCAEDKTVKTVGSTTSKGEMSPKRMLATTITDELRLASNMRSKVVGIALKDRGAILPAGHTANAAYWFDDKVGKWISSTFYMNNLPKWVDDLNEKNLPQQYLSQDWTPLLDMSAYKASIADDNAFEGKWKGEASSSFPHFLPELQKEYGIGLIRATPFGNSLTKDMALAALRGEKLGQGKETDFLCLSFSSTDYVGHFYGVQAIETEDTYIRLDRDLAEIFKALDKEVGKNNYLVFLTADHAAVEAPEYLKSVKIPAGLFNPSSLEKEVKTFCQAKFGDSLVQTVVNQHIYLKETVLVQKKLNRLEVSEQIATAIRRKEGIAQVWTYNDFLHLPPSDDISRKVFNGFYEKRCGDVIYNLEPSWSEHEKTGTTHGSPYTYDTHVPLLFYGWNVPHGSTDMPLQIDDIAPTLSMMLQIRLPNGCTGKPIPFYKK